MSVFAESIDQLKAALAAIDAAYADKIAAMGPMDALDAMNGYNSCLNRMKWLRADLISVIKDEWWSTQTDETPAGEQSPMAKLRSVSETVDTDQTIDEAGATLSKATKDALNSAISALTNLMAPPKDDATEDETKEAESAKATAISLIKDTESTLAGVEAVLTAKARKKIPDAQFADPEHRKYPIHDKAHADNAMARLEQNKDSMSDAEYKKIHAKIKAAQKKFGESVAPIAPVVPEPVTVEDLRDPAHLSTILSEAHILAEGSDPSNHRYKMLVIKEGLSGNRVEYKGPMLAESVPLLNGRPMYIDHPAGIAEGKPQPRSIENKVGWWSDAKWEEGIATSSGVVNGITATANLLPPEASPKPWFPGMVAEALASGHPDVVGVSILAVGDFKLAKDGNGMLYKEALRITKYASADAVAEPGAGGQPLSLVAHQEVDKEIMEFEKLTLEELKTARPDLVAELAKTDPPAPDKDDRVAATVAEMQQVLDASKRQNTQLALSNKLAATKLPDAVRTLIRARVGDAIMAEADIDTIVNEYNTVAESIATEVVGRIPGNQGLTAGVIVPFRGMTQAEQFGPLDQVMHALYDFFGAPVAEAKGKHPIITNFREFYASVTGDYTVDGVVNKQQSVIGEWYGEPFAEALPGATHIVGGGTITMANLLGTAMNKALLDRYAAQPRWFEPIVKKTRLNDMKTQTRILLHNFGSLTERTVDGAEYTELDWNETAETWTPTEFGNVVTVGRRAIINDDLKGIQSLPELLGQSAAVTINEFVSSLFTSNSGNGPTLADGQQVFNAANHQGNRVTTAFSRTNVLALRKVIRSMNNAASKRLSLVPRYLLGPIDLEADMFELVTSEKVPESANNAPNLLASAQGLRAAIVVPNWTDANNWYLMCDPAQITGIELGFLFGREDPEMFTQTDPSTGFVFTNDAMAWKIRHDYGGDWVDYRAAAAAIVA